MDRKRLLKAIGVFLLIVLILVGWCFATSCLVDMLGLVGALILPGIFLSCFLVLVIYDMLD